MDVVLITFYIRTHAMGEPGRELDDRQFDQSNLAKVLVSLESQTHICLFHEGGNGALPDKDRRRDEAVLRRHAVGRLLDAANADACNATRSGQTPGLPCLLCNTHVVFSALLHNHPMK